MAAYAKETDPLYIKPARELTDTDALAVLLNLQSIGDIALPDFKADARTPPRQIKMSTKVAGIQYLQASGNNRGAFGSVGATKRPDFMPSPPFALVLYKLAVFLHDQWGATSIVWGGIGAAGAGKSDDCHQNGHCVDFYGADTTTGGVFDVRRDWYRRGVYQKVSGKRHALKPDSDDRWGIDFATYYRLAQNTDPEKLVGASDYFNPKAGDFFADVYEFVNGQCAQGRYDIAPDSFRNGEPLKAGWTIHPDYPTILRRSHNDHMHFQLGST